MLANAPIAAILPCVDLAQARQFYGQTLGLLEIPIPTSAPVSDSEQTAAMFQCGGDTMLLVYLREKPTQADHTAAGWIVEDLESVVDELIGRGVRLEVYEQMPGVEWDDRGVAYADQGKGAWFKDPDGNILSLTEAPRQDQG